MSYTKIGARISLLPISQFCGMAAQLSEAHGAGRAAAMSSAWHAQAAGAEDAPAKLARLTPEERAAIEQWKKPTPVKVLGVELTYEASAKEQPVGLTGSGEFAESGEVVTCGTLDFAWIVEHPDPFIGRVAVIGDLKKTRWASSGPDSLQLLTYGYAWAKKHGCRAFITGIWVIEDEEWQWAQEVHELDSFAELDLFYRIKSAALNTTGEAAFGEHCSNCYGRLHCGEYTAPAALAESWLNPVTVGGAIDDPAKLGAMLSVIRRIEPLIERAKETAREAARRGLQITDPATGEFLKAIQCKGRESLNQARLFAAIPEATKFIERGEPYSQMRWTKPPKVKAAAK